MNTIDFKNIYENSFNDTNYNKHEDEEYRFQTVKNFVIENNITSVLDVGSGRGNVIKILNEVDSNIKITSCDLKKFHNYNCEFLELDLCDKNSLSNLENKNYDLIVCLDVLEHVQKECVEDIFKTLSKISNFTILTIANHSDIHNGVELHLIRENMSYWEPIIQKYFDILNFDEKYGGRLYLLNLKNKK
jgi:2-polyprenyl-3-methyl-5-hydroxy-6-metoxy-1,4-benzoquinol methylase